jgi:hypothetical protein
MSGTDEDFEVSIPASSEVPRLRLRRLRPHGDALVVLTVSAEEVGLSASVDVHTLNGDGLDDFFIELDKDFRGWPGERHWKSHEGDLELEAVHCGRVILLAWTLRFPSPAEESWDWQVTLRVPITPGEELKNLASTIAAMLS